MFKDLLTEERKNRHPLSVRPLVEAYFVWVKENIPKVPKKSKTWEGLNYSINQEKYLKVFLDDGKVLDLCQYVGQKKSKDYAVFLSSSSSFCCGVK